MIDIHHHLLYGLDDGPNDSETMQQMLKAASSDGVRTLIATPHITPGITPFSIDLFYARLSEAQKLCDTLALNLRVLLGAEVLYSRQMARYLADGRIPTLGGSNKLLLEFPENVTFETIKEAVHVVVNHGMMPVLAHIERYRSLMLPVRRAEVLKENYDVCYQINCNSILTNKNQRISHSIRNLFQLEKIDFVASDAHDCNARRCNMNEAYDKLVTTLGRKYTDRLTGKHTTMERFLS